MLQHLAREILTQFGVHWDACREQIEIQSESRLCVTFLFTAQNYNIIALFWMINFSSLFVFYSILSLMHFLVQGRKHKAKHKQIQQNVQVQWKRENKWKWFSLTLSCAPTSEKKNIVEITVRHTLAFSTGILEVFFPSCSIHRVWVISMIRFLLLVSLFFAHKVIGRTWKHFSLFSDKFINTTFVS